MFRLFPLALKKSTFLIKKDFAATPVGDADMLRKICKILGTHYYLYNEEIEIDKDVRLIDTKGKLVGVYNLKEALKKTDKMKQDLVLINEKVKPAICKVMNYKETLFRQFIKEISGKEQLEKTKVKKIKQVSLKPNISANDLKNKVRFASELGKKCSQLNVMVNADFENEEQAKNVVLTVKKIKNKMTQIELKFRDLSKEFLEPIGEMRITTTKYSISESDGEEEEEIEIKKMVVLEFRFLKQEEKKEEKIDEDKVRRLINLYYQKEGKEPKSEEVKILSEVDEELKQEVEQQKKDLKVDTKDIEENLLKGISNLKEKKVTKKESKEVTSFLDKALAREREKNQEVLDKIEEFKQRLGFESNEELFQYTMKNFSEKWDRFDKLKKVVERGKGRKL